MTKAEENPRPLKGKTGFGLVSVLALIVIESIPINNYAA
jgi:hypothetical protein